MAEDLLYQTDSYTKRQSKASTNPKKNNGKQGVTALLVLTTEYRKVVVGILFE